MGKYWVYVDGEVHGPYEPKEIYRLDRFHELKYCRKGDDQWQSFEDIDDLQPSFLVYREQGVSGPYEPDEIFELDGYEDLQYVRIQEVDWKPIDDFPELEAKPPPVTPDPNQTASETPEPDQADKSKLIEATKRNVTTLFADLAGFTKMTERLGDEQALETVNQIFEQLVPIITRHGGQVDQYIGDEIMALFGATSAHEDDPERAVYAALAMFDEIEQLNQSDQLPNSVSLHVGINTGKVVAEEDEADDGRSFSVTGSGVTIAQALTAEAGDNEILVGPETKDRLRGRVDLEKDRDLPISSIDDTVPAHRVTGRRDLNPASNDSTKASSESNNSTRERSLPFVSRQEELEQLNRLLQPQSSDGPTAALVSGPGGVGKTRLLLQFQQEYLPNSYHVHSVQGFAYGEKLPFNTILPLIDDLLGIQSPQSRPAEPGELERIQPVLPEWQETLGNLYGIETYQEDLDISKSNDQNDQVQQLTSDITSIILELLPQPSVIFFDDAQWSDPFSIDVIANLNEEIQQTGDQHRLLLDSRPYGIRTVTEEDLAIPENAARTEMHVETSSPSEDPVLTDFIDSDDRLIHRELSPLTHDEIRQLMETAFPGATFSNRFVNLIQNKTGGLPIHVEQLLWSLVDNGIIKKTSADQWTVQEDAHQVDLPSTLHDLIVSRVDRLTDSPSETLLVSSVLGNQFETWLLEAIVHREDGQLREEINQLLQRGFLREQEDELVFQHATIQEVTYDLLLEDDRKQFHANAARELRDNLPLKDPTTIERLAVHYRGAEDHQALMEIHVLGAEQALERRTLDEAERFLSRIQSDGGDQLAADWQARYHSAQGRLAHYRRDLQRARDQHEQALEIKRSLGDRRGETIQLWSLGKIYQEAEEFDEARDYHRQAKELAEQMNNDRLKAMALWGLARIAERNYNWEQAESFNKQALELDRKTGDHKGQAVRLGTLGVIAERQGNLGQAIEYHQQALSKVKKLGDVQGQAFHLGTMARLAEKEDRLEEARDFAHSALELEDKIDNPRGVIIQYHTLGRIEEQKHNFQEAKKHIRRAIRLEEDHPNQKDRKILHGALGRINKALGNYDRALKAHETALELEQEDGNTKGMIHHYSSMGEICEESGRFDQAVEHLEQAQELSQQVEDADTVEHRSLGKLHLKTGQFVRALECFRKELKKKRRHTDQFGEAIMLSLVGNVFNVTGKPRQAVDFYQQSIAINEAIDNETGLAIVHSSLAEVRQQLDQIESAIQHLQQAIDINITRNDDWAVSHQLAELLRFHSDQENLHEADSVAEQLQDRVATVDHDSIYYTAYRALARWRQAHDDRDGFYEYLRQAGAQYELPDSLLNNQQLQPEEIPGAKASKLLLDRARGEFAFDHHETASKLAEGTRDRALMDQSDDWFELLRQSTRLLYRRSDEEPPSPTDLLEQHYGISLTDAPEIKVESSVEATVEQSPDDGSLDPEENTVTRDLFRTEFKQDDQYGPSILVLVDDTKSGVHELQEQLPYSMSSVFDSQYDDDYQYGFFIQNPDSNTIETLNQTIQATVENP